MVARNYSNIAVVTTLASGITSGAGTLSVVSASGWPAAPFILILEADTVNEELVLVGGKSGTTFSSLTRGFGGTSGVAHNAGAQVKHVAVAEDHSIVWTHAHNPANDFTAVAHTNLISVGVNDHHNQQHVLTGTDHTASGLTTNHVLRATGATTFGFGQVQHSHLGGVGIDDHHARDHAGTHAFGSTDELTAASLSSGAAGSGQLLTAIGDGSASWQNPVDVTAAAVDSGASTDGQVLTSDGAGNAAWENLPPAVTDHGALTGLGDDDHTQYHNDARAATWAAGWHDVRDHTAVANTMHPFEMASGQHAGGSAASPGITFQTDSNTGFYSLANDGVIHWSGNGTHGGLMNSGGIDIVDGSVSAPPYSFLNDPDTGIYRVASGVLGLAGNGVLQMITGNSTNPGIQVADGDATVPGIRFASDTDSGWYRTSNNIWNWAGGGQENLRIQNIANGTTSVLSLRDGLTDVGNVETLRLNRGTGTLIAAVGYFSSWEFDRQTGARAKTGIIDLTYSPNFPGLEIIDQINMIDFERVSTGEREWGVNLNSVQNLGIDNLKYLTTKGDQWGDSPDEMAFIAVLWEAMKEVRKKVGLVVV